jgi:hypothetical protein
MIDGAPMAAAIPVNLPWNAEATVVGILIVILLLIAFGWLVPRWYIKALEKKYDHQQTILDSQAESLETLADWAKTQTDVGETVAHTMTTLQQRGGENE